MTIVSGVRDIERHMRHEGQALTSPLRFVGIRDNMGIFIDICTGDTYELEQWRLWRVKKVEGDLYRFINTKGRIKVVKDETIPNRGSEEA